MPRVKWGTLHEIQQQEKKIQEKLAGRDPQDVNLSDELKSDIKWYKGLIMQYNADALTTACVRPYKDKYPLEPISNQEFQDKFENERCRTLSAMCFLNPSKINALCSEIDRSSLSIFKKSVNPSVEKLLLHLKEKHAHNLMATDPFIVSAPAQLERF